MRWMSVLFRKMEDKATGPALASEHHEGKALDELARALLVQEHSSMRAEILASYGYAQSIVRWTLATFAAIAGAGLVAINNATGATKNSLLIDAILVIFGIGLPAIVWLYSYTWVGELLRAERAGSFLRALERDIARVGGLSERLGFQPLRWESFIWANRQVKKSPWGKQVITYLGTAGVFLGCSVGGVVMLWIVLTYLLGEKEIDDLDFWFWLAGSTFANFFCLGVFVYMCTRVFAVGAAAAPLESIYGDIFSRPSGSK